MNIKQSLGFTLVEVLTILVIVGILASIAIPSFQGQFKIRRLEGATEILFGALQNAKAEAVKRDRKMKIQFTPGDDSEQSTWCYAMAKNNQNCDCITGMGCIPGGVVVKSTDYKNIKMQTNESELTFNHLSGFSNDGTVTLSVGSASEHLTTGVVVSSKGRVRICHKPDSVIYTKHTDCP